MNIDKYVSNFTRAFPSARQLEPWSVIRQFESILTQKFSQLNGDEYTVDGDIAIHRSATIEQGVILKGKIIIGAKCFVGAHAYLRGGIYIDNNVSIGPGCEVKTSIILPGSALAHFNFVGDSIVGSNVNMEAGSIIANHYNERSEREIQVVIDGNKIKTGVTKFGALVGDGVKIGANAVLSPGTILSPGQIVGRLELVDQL